MTVAIDRRMTLDEFLSYDDGSDRHYELVNGVLVEMGAESRTNIKTVLFLIQVFLQIVGYGRLGIKEKIEVTSQYVTARDPDLIIHSDASALAIADRSEACLKYGDPNPLIVIEIVSPGDEKSDNYQRDYVQKAYEYAERSIPEYWIVDPKRSLICIGKLIAKTYHYTEFKNGEAIISPTFPNLILTAAEILAAGR